MKIFVETPTSSEKQKQLLREFSELESPANLVTQTIRSNFLDTLLPKRKGFLDKIKDLFK